MRQRGVLMALVALSAVALLLVPAAAPQAQTRIGYVDVSRILAGSGASAAARRQLEQEKASLQQAIDRHRAEVEKLRGEIDKNEPNQSPELRKEKRATLDRKTRDLTRRVDDSRRELEKKRRALLGGVLRELWTVIKRYGKEHGYQLILEKRSGGVVYGSADADLTDKIIEADNREWERTRTGPIPGRSAPGSR